MATTLIYDIGANNGDDIGYYLKKADRVIAVEANPALCDVIRTRYADQISSGALVVENVVLTDEANDAAVLFHIHRTNHVLSQFPAPPASHAAAFEAIALPALSVAELVARHGQPHYVKIDLEHYDAQVLRALFASGVFPDYLSVEAHQLDVFALLVTAGGYRAFKLVDGRSVAERYGQHFIMSTFGRELHEFPFHSAGPFGIDIPGPWMTAGSFLRLLRIVGLGWKDIHASRVDEPRDDIPRWLLPPT